MKSLLSIVTVLAIVAGSGVAFADSGDGPQFALPQPVPATGPATTFIGAAPLTNDVGDEREAVFAGYPSLVELNTAGLLPAGGGEAPLPTANTVPTGVEDGTLGW